MLPRFTSYLVHWVTLAVMVLSLSYFSFFFFSCIILIDVYESLLVSKSWCSDTSLILCFTDLFTFAKCISMQLGQSVLFPGRIQIRHDTKCAFSSGTFFVPAAVFSLNLQALYRFFFDVSFLFEIIPSGKMFFVFLLCNAFCSKTSSVFAMSTCFSVNHLHRYCFWLSVW